MSPDFAAPTRADSSSFTTCEGRGRDCTGSNLGGLMEDFSIPKGSTVLQSIRNPLGMRRFRTISKRRRRAASGTCSNCWRPRPLTPLGCASILVSNEVRSSLFAESLANQGCFMRTLPDYLRKGMKMVLVGANPGDRSARVGHYYAGRGNQFWPIMYQSGVIPEPLGYEDDRRMLEFGIGMTDLVKRPTRGIDEIERQEFAEGRVLLAQKLEELRPRVIAFNGKITYEKFTGRPCKLGLQKEKLYGAQVFVLPSTSGLNGGTERGVKTRYFKKLAALLKSLKD